MSCLVNVQLIFLEKWEENLGPLSTGCESSLGPKGGHLCLTVDIHGLS